MRCLPPSSDLEEGSRRGYPLFLPSYRFMDHVLPRDCRSTSSSLGWSDAEDSQIVGAIASLKLWGSGCAELRGEEVDGNMCRVVQVLRSKQLYGARSTVGGGRQTTGDERRSSEKAARSARARTAQDCRLRAAAICARSGPPAAARRAARPVHSRPPRAFFAQHINKSFRLLAVTM